MLRGDENAIRRWAVRQRHILRTYPARVTGVAAYRVAACGVMVVAVHEILRRSASFEEGLRWTVVVEIAFAVALCLGPRWPSQ